MNRSRIFVAAALISLLLSSCAPKKPAYDISAQTPAECLAPGQWDNRPAAAAACELPAAGSGTAYDYLAGICRCGHRRAGSGPYRCAATFVAEQLRALGYEVTEQTFTFPYYQFDPDKTSVVRVRDAKNFPAYPMHYSANPGGTLTGRLVRPGRDVKGCFILAPSMLSGFDLKGHYPEWKKAGALGVVVAADLSPLAARGLRHSRNAHTLSWRYSPLPGWVVERPEELVGETITAFHDGRIVPGTGINVIGRGPQKTGRPVLVTGHLDSWFEGALDDATGVAAMLAAARALRGSPEDLVFAAVDAEEVGLIGSAALSLLLPPEEVKAVVELDMVSNVNTSLGGKSGTSPRIVTVSRGLRLPAMRAIEPLPGLAIYPGARFARSLTGGFATDFEWYYTRGTPGVFIYTPSHWYHTENDTLDFITPADMNATGDAVAAITRDLRDSGSLKPPREFVPLEVSVTPKKGDTVEIRVRPSRGFIAGLGGEVTVSAYWNYGFEKRLTLKKGADGAWSGRYRLCRPGDWQFLAMASQGGRSGRRWVSLVH